MPMRITRRTFVGRLIGAASAAASLGLLPRTVGAAPEQALTPRPPLPSGESAGLPTFGPVGEGEQVTVRMAELGLGGRAFWAGLADGVRLPSQGGDAWSLAAERPGGTYTSPPLQAEFSCTHVGVHWRTDGGDQTGLRVELR